MEARDRLSWDLAWARDGRVEIRLHRGWLLLDYTTLFLVLPGIGFLMTLSGNLGAVVGGWFLLLVAAVCLAFEVGSRRWGRPALVVTRDGVSMPVHGYALPWSMVHGAMTMHHNHRDHLYLAVGAVTDADRARPPRMPWFRRILSRGRPPADGVHMVPGPLGVDVHELAAWLDARAREELAHAVQLQVEEARDRGPR